MVNEGKVAINGLRRSIKFKRKHAERFHRFLYVQERFDDVTEC